MHSSNFNSDWKSFAKQALQQAPQSQGGGDPSQQSQGSPGGQQATTDTATLEKNFMDQSYQMLQNVALPFIQGGKQLGFEVVYKNPSCSKMVGVFIFRVSSREMFYAPALFAAGQVKVDLLYRVSTKSFVPLSPDWCDYFLQRNPGGEGQGVDPSVKMQANNYADLVSIIQPPRYRKMASVTPETPLNLFEESILEMFEKAAAVEDEKFNESILSRFIVEDGGYSAIQKIASAAKKSYPFANALFMSCDESEYYPDLEAMDKAAAEAPVPADLAIYQDLLNNPHVKSAGVTPEDLRQNFKIVDNRKQADLNEVTWEANTMELDGISEPNIYEVLMADGSREKCMVAYSDDEMLDPHCHNSISYAQDTGARPKLLLVNLGTRESRAFCGGRSIFGRYAEDINKSSELRESMSSGKGYRLYSMKDKALGPYRYVKSVGRTDAGLSKYELVTRKSDGLGMGDTLIHNPDYDGPIDGDCVVGRNYRFVEVGTDETTYNYSATCKNLEPGEKGSIENWIFGQGYKKATIDRLSNSSGYVLRRSDSERRTPPLTKLAMRLALMNELDLTETAAEEVLTATDASRKHQFFYKCAQQLQWRQFPEFYQQFNQDYNVPEEDLDTMKYRILAQGNRPMQLRHRVGDGIKLNNPNENAQGSAVGGVPLKSDTNNAAAGVDLSTATPEQLYALSQKRGIGNLFEHGVVGSLVKTYDSIALVDKYIPDLEKALDKLGRIVFLLSWKPEDFIKAYGADDQSELENKLLSNFKALGELVIELLLKSTNPNQGSPGLK